MKKLMLVPILGLIFAVGMSFTTFENSNAESIETAASDYVNNNGSWQAIPEQNCTGGVQECRVQFGPNGPIYKLYDEMDLDTLKETSDGTIIVL